MAVDPNIKKKADDIRNKIYGKEVRESLASGLEAMSSDVVENTGRQDVVEGQFQEVVENTTDKDVISAPEIIAARNGKPNLKRRIDDLENETTAQLAQTANSIPYVSNQMLNSKSSVKSLIRRDENWYLLTTRKASGKGYVQFSFQKDVGTDADNSNYGGEKELLRLVGVFDGSGSSYYYMWKHPEQFDGIGFTRREFGRPSGRYPSTLKVLTNSDDENLSTSYLEFQINVDTLPSDKMLSMLFHPSTITNQNVTVSVNGETVSTDINTRSNDFSFVKVSLSKFTGTVTVRLTPTGDRKTIQFLGYNAYSIENAPANIEYNSVTYQMLGGNHYTRSNGANDYALQEYNGKWMGSFHGGETSEYLKVLLDKIDITNLPIDDVAFGTRFQIIQRTDLIGKIKTNSLTEIYNDGIYNFECAFNVIEPFEVSNFYTAMTCSNTTFTDVISPNYRSMSGTEDFELLKTGKTIQLSPTDNHQIVTLYNIHNKYKGSKNNYIRLSPSYAKFYHGKVVEDRDLLQDIAFSSVKLFD